MINAEIQVQNAIIIYSLRNRSIYSLFTSIDQFQRVGQNLGTIGSSPNEPDTNDAIRGIIQSFYNENKDATMSDINSFNGVTAAK